MRPATDTMTRQNGGTGNAHERALKILAKSIYRELRNNGYSRGEMVSFANELLTLVIESDPVSPADRAAAQPHHPLDAA